MVSAVKHKPATPLPWLAEVKEGDLCLKGDDGRDLIGRVDLADYDRPDVERENVEYMAHAANAYPKLMERTARRAAFLRRLMAQIPQLARPYLEGALADEALKDEAMLREIGEDGQ